MCRHLGRSCVEELDRELTARRPQRPHDAVGVDNLQPPAGGHDNSPAGEARGVVLLECRRALQHEICQGSHMWQLGLWGGRDEMLPSRGLLPCLRRRRLLLVLRHLGRWS